MSAPPKIADRAICDYRELAVNVPGRAEAESLNFAADAARPSRAMVPAKRLDVRAWRKLSPAPTMLEY
jgi:hypothetical protein